VNDVIEGVMARGMHSFSVQGPHISTVVQRGVCMRSCRVAIVGGPSCSPSLTSITSLRLGGIAGCSAAYHLVKAGVREIILIEAGVPGDGNFDPVKAPTSGSFRLGDFGGEDGESFKYAQRSGSAVLPAPASHIKMMVNLYPSSSEDFCQHHGKEGARRYLALAAEGIQIEKDLAQSVMSPESMFRSYGSLYVAEEKDVANLRHEYELLVELSCQGIEWWDEEQVLAHSGGQSAQFRAGIYFPFDGVINSGQVCPSSPRCH
jgi:hypothetical protein